MHIGYEIDYVKIKERTNQQVIWRRKSAADGMRRWTDLSHGWLL